MDAGSVVASPQSRTPRESYRKGMVTSPQSYYLMSKIHSLASMTAFDRIKLDVSHSMVSNTQEKSSHHATTRHSQHSPLRLLQTSRSKQWEQASILKGVLTSEQKIVQSKLRVEDLTYQRLLILDAELDLLILAKEAQRKSTERQLNNEIRKIETFKAELYSKQSTLAKRQKDIDLFYEFLSYLKNPNREPNKQSIKLERQNRMEEDYNEMVKLLAEETTDYDTEIKLKQQELAETKQQISIASGKLKKQRQQKHRTKLHKLEAHKRALAAESIAMEKRELVEEESQISKQIEFYRQFDCITQLQIVESKSISQSIVDQLRQSFHEAAIQKKQLSRFIRDIRLIQRSREKHRFRQQAQLKKIEMLRKKISKLSAEPSTIDTGHQSMQ